MSTVPAPLRSVTGAATAAFPRSITTTDKAQGSEWKTLPTELQYQVIRHAIASRQEIPKKQAVMPMLQVSCLHVDKKMRDLSLEVLSRETYFIKLQIRSCKLHGNSSRVGQDKLAKHYPQSLLLHQLDRTLPGNFNYFDIRFGCNNTCSSERKLVNYRFVVDKLSLLDLEATIAHRFLVLRQPQSVTIRERHSFSGPLVPLQILNSTPLGWQIKASDKGTKPHREVTDWIEAARRIPPTTSLQLYALGRSYLNQLGDLIRSGSPSHHLLPIIVSFTKQHYFLQTRVTEDVTYNEQGARTSGSSLSYVFSYLLISSLADQLLRLPNTFSDQAHPLLESRSNQTNVDRVAHYLNHILRICDKYSLSDMTDSQNPVPDLVCCLAVRARAKFMLAMARASTLPFSFTKTLALGVDCLRVRVKRRWRTRGGRTWAPVITDSPPKHILQTVWEEQEPQGWLDTASMDRLWLTHVAVRNQTVKKEVRSWLDELHTISSQIQEAVTARHGGYGTILQEPMILEPAKFDHIELLYPNTQD